ALRRPSLPRSAAERLPGDRGDHALITDPGDTSGPSKARTRAEVGVRVHFEDHRLAAGVEPDVDTSVVPAGGRTKGGDGERTESVRKLNVNRRGTDHLARQVFGRAVVPLGRV